MKFRGVVLGAVAIGVVSAVALPAPGIAAAGGASSWRPGYYDSQSFIHSDDDGDTGLLDYVRDASGGSHALLDVRPRHSAPGQHYAYLTRAHGASTWTAHTIRGWQQQRAEPPTLGVSRSGHQVFLFGTTGFGQVYFQSEPAAAKTFPTLTAADRIQMPKNDPGNGQARVISSPEELSHHRLTFVDLTDALGLRVVTASPGRVATTQQLVMPTGCLPNTPVWTRDATTGSVTVAVECKFNPQPTYSVVTWTRRDTTGSKFGTPHIAFHQGPTGPLTPGPLGGTGITLAAADGEVYLGLTNERGLFVLHGRRSTHSWTKPRRLIRNRGCATGYLDLAANPRSHRIEAVYESQNNLALHVTTHPSTHGHWSTPTNPVHHQPRTVGEQVEGLVATGAAGFRIAYYQQSHQGGRDGTQDNEC